MFIQTKHILYRLLGLNNRKPRHEFSFIIKFLLHGNSNKFVQIGKHYQKNVTLFLIYYQHIISKWLIFQQLEFFRHSPISEEMKKEGWHLCEVRNL